MAKKEKKSFTITLEERDDGVQMTSISAGNTVEPKEMFDGLLGGLAALYINVWGQPQRVHPPLAENFDDDLSPEEFCQLVVNKVLARLESYSVAQGTVQ